MKTTWKSWVGSMAVLGTLAVGAVSAQESAAPTPGTGWTSRHQTNQIKALRPKKADSPVQVVKWVCPMGEYVGDKPGKCPKCGMTLEKRVKTVAPAKKAKPGQP